MSEIMKISAKGRYALASTVHMAQRFQSGEYIPVISISDALGISKIYLEQVFSLLKGANIVLSVKGAQGGYQLAKSPKQISVKDVLLAVELSLFEHCNETVGEKAPEIEAALRTAVFEILDETVAKTLEKISLADLMREAQRQKDDNSLMFYI